MGETIAILGLGIMSRIRPHGALELVSKRIEGRHGDFMHPNLLSSQFALLDPPGDANRREY